MKSLWQIIFNHRCFGIILGYGSLLSWAFLPAQSVSISGIYPHLAHYNKGGECGTGAVVPWAGKLWVVTYSPHFPQGSSDKLYEITPDLRQIVRPESIGGTPANRMIHRESNQLFIGPHVIDADGKVRTIPYSTMPGRHTGNARHLIDPGEKIYYGTMEEGFYEVGVADLQVNMLYKDGNKNGKVEHHNPTDINPENATLPGAHGKGLYSGQGVLVYSNNGEATEEALKKFDIKSGALAEWDGKDWKLVRRNQFVEVTGPGGIYGNNYPATDPIWATGWDHKSILLGVREPTGWHFYRLPKASHSYDGAHGWNTEWPRIRDVGIAGKPDYLMTMHGMFWRFPKSFTAQNTSGLRPRSAYLKVIGDFTRWNDRLVFGCDDSAQKEFLNKRKQKGSIEGPGQSNSNLWFTDFSKPDLLGPNSSHGAVWIDESVVGASFSEPFLFAGWKERIAWIKHDGPTTIPFSFQVDLGQGQWQDLHTIHVPPGKAKLLHFDSDDPGEWIRVRVANDCRVTLSFNYSEKDQRMSTATGIFGGLAAVDQGRALGGLLYGLGEDRRALGMSARLFDGASEQAVGYYELDENLQLIAKEDRETRSFIDEKFAVPHEVVSLEQSSVLVVDDQGRRWRFPRGTGPYDQLTRRNQLRICREVATERDLFSCHGTFYELPAENADGFAKVRPIASHTFRIHDYASYRGMLVMTGLNRNGNDENPHIIRSKDGKAAVWVGTIDDLWELGKPRGMGGPWYESEVVAGQPSDPYLIAFYDRRSMTISHSAQSLITFHMEVDPTGNGTWMRYESMEVDPTQIYQYDFADDFEARWVRFIASADCYATIQLKYE